MRFLIVLLSLNFAITGLSVVDHSGNLAYEATQQERRLHRKLLRSIQNTQYAVAANELKSVGELRKI